MPSAKYFSALCPLACIVFALFVWLTVLSNVTLGFDISDTGHYLLYASRYEDVSIGVTSFGLVTRLLYFAAGQTVARFNLLGAVILLGVAFFTCWVTLPLVTNDIKKAKRYTQITLATAICTAAAFYYYIWLSTPSYNWLNLLACLLVWNGLILMIPGRLQRPLEIFGAGLLIGSGMALSFHSRPPTAAGLFVIAVAAYFILRPQNVRLIFAGAIIGGNAVFFIPLWLARQSLVDFIAMYLRGFNAFTSGEIYTFDIQPFLVRLGINSLWWFLIPISFVCVFVVVKYRSRFSSIRRGHIGIALMLLFLLGLSVMVFVGYLVDIRRVDILLLGILLLVLLSSLLSLLRRGLLWPAERVRARLFWVMAAVAFAFVYTLGTNNPYPFVMAWAICFIVIALLLSLTLFPANVAHNLLKTVPVLLTVTLSGIFLFFPRAPYRQSQFSEMTTSVDIRGGLEQITVTPAEAAFYYYLQNGAYVFGFTAGTPILDLTGHAPGLIYAFNGRSPVTPWLLGGYANSEELARIIIGHWPRADLMNAWILTSEGDRHLDPGILRGFSLDFPERYAIASRWIHPYYNEEITVWKPATELN